MLIFHCHVIAAHLHEQLSVKESKRSTLTEETVGLLFPLAVPNGQNIHPTYNRLNTVIATLSYTIIIIFNFIRYVVLFHSLCLVPPGHHVYLQYITGLRHSPCS
jgi:hypothetical protein